MKNNTILGIFTGHMEFAHGIIKATEVIIGKQKNYAIISNHNKDYNDIYRDLEKIIIDYSFDHCFIFIDFYGSSFSTPALLIKNKHKNISIIFGYNLPIVIDFFIHRIKKEPFELYEKLIEIGKNAIKCEF